MAVYLSARLSVGPTIYPSPLCFEHISKTKEKSNFDERCLMWKSLTNPAFLFYYVGLKMSKLLLSVLLF